MAGIHIEDQVFPKKCGFFEGKQVVPMEEHVQKVRAALDARTDPDFVIIARCDAYAVTGWKDTVRRCQAYKEAGADLVFVGRHQIYGGTWNFTPGTCPTCPGCITATWLLLRRWKPWAIS